MPGTRSVAVACTSALGEASSGINESGVPTLSPLSLAEDIHQSSRRWESICRLAVDVKGSRQMLFWKKRKRTLTISPCLC